jgi:predicted cupin superfamily sugar epimerase
MYQQLVEIYGLLPHPEGGFYKENYIAAEQIPHASLPHRFSGDRPFSTAIYFLLTQENFSAFHRIKSDECWHFYEGDALLVHVIKEDGNYELIQLGSNTINGEVYQAIVPAGAWFASESVGAYSFVGCTVAPGFDFTDFELAEKNALLGLYPNQHALIERLCR